MAESRPHTRDYAPDARERLGLAVQRAREGMGHAYRPSFATLIGKSVRSLVKLEQGAPVGPTVYEAAADHLPGWDRDTPKAILDGGPPPVPTGDTAEMSPARRRIVEMSWAEVALRIADSVEVQGAEEAGKLLESIVAMRVETRQGT